MTERLLLGSGPSPVPRQVLEALARPTLGHLDPAFGAIMDECKSRLREVFRTGNDVTFPVSGTGSAGMEATVVNFVKPGDRVVCGVAGLFGERMADELARHGAEVVRVEAEWGRAIAPEALTGATDRFDALFVVHGETSTGVRQPLDGLADVCRARDALLLVDCVTSLSGVPLGIDEDGIDVAFSGSQKCLNCPPGLAPLTAGPRAMERLNGASSWYFDLNLVLGYWSGEGGRSYHHTAPTNMIVALNEALGLVLDEGLEARWDRHAQAHDTLVGDLRERGFERLAPEGEQLASLLCVRVPDGLDEAAARKRLLLEHDIEVSGGLGPLTGQVWRIGLMGAGARGDARGRLLSALDAVLA